MSNLKFYEAVLRDELPISKEWADKGWPPLLYPWFLACAQLPDADEPAKRAFTLAMGDDIKAGVLPAERRRVPWFIERDITEPHVSRCDFATWLQAQRMEPSPLVREWIDGLGWAVRPWWQWGRQMKSSFRPTNETHFWSSLPCYAAKPKLITRSPQKRRE